MDFDYILEIINHQLTIEQNCSLSATETLILQGIWQDKTYGQIASEEGYSAGYLTNVAAPEMYQRLSKLLDQRVTKKNCRQRLTSYVSSQLMPVPRKQNTISVFSTEKANLDINCLYPSGPIALKSPCYLERLPFEGQMRHEIVKPGALVRIKAPREMGKTSLLLRGLDYARHQGYYTVYLNLAQVDEGILGNLNKFLRWLCANVARQLEIKPRLNEYWDEDLGSKISCTAYVQDYLLQLVDSPLVLALDEVSRIFEYSLVAKDFLLLLRSWYEESKILAVWQKIRLIVVHSIEGSVPLKVNQSPFNVGFPIYLTPFDEKDVQQLASCYGLNWREDKEIKQLMQMVGGHPALIHIAIYHLSRQEITLADLLQTAMTATGVYTHHLQRHWVTLQQQPELITALCKVINSDTSVEIDSILTYQLCSLGLVKQIGNKVIPSCELYRRYFERLIK